MVISTYSLYKHTILRASLQSSKAAEYMELFHVENCMYKIAISATIQIHNIHIKSCISPKDIDTIFSTNEQAEPPLQNL